MTELRELYLNDNPVLSDISVISNYKELTRLNLSNTNVSDITPLLKLTNLEWIDLTGLQIPKGQKIKLKEKIKGITIIE